MKFQELAAERYSCRQMTDQKVDDKLIEHLIETAILAPTAVNKQPFKIFWMKSDEAKEAIHKVTRFTFGADTFLVIGSKKEDGWVRSFDNHSFAEVDASIVATHIMMDITDLGLATTWVGYFDAPLLKSLRPEMEDYELIAIFPIGYAADGNGAPSPRHTVRKSREDLVEYL